MEECARAHGFVRNTQQVLAKLRENILEQKREFRIPLVWHMTLRHWVITHISSSQRTTTVLPTLEDEATALSANVLISFSND